MSEVTCGEAVVEMLERAGAEVAFGVLSVHNLPLYDAMARRGRMRTVAATSENGALGMADGYARATGRLGVGITSTGVGAANAAGALLEAYTASSRVLHVTGQVDSAVVAHDRGALHGARDQLGLLRSISKAAYRVEAAGDAAQLVCRAIEQVHSERPGPVSIEIPIDLQYARVQEPPADLAPRPPERATPRAEAIAAAVEGLASAERPLIWAGGGVIAADASASLLALAEDIGAGVITTQAGRGALPESHPLCIGNFSLEDSVGDLLRDSDVLLAVGTRFRGNETRGWQLSLPRPLVRIDSDPTVLFQNYAPDVALLGDAQATLDQLARRLPRQRSANAAWRERVARAGAAARARWRATLGNHTRLLEDLSSALPEDAIVVRDVTVPATVWGSRLLEVRRPRAVLHSASMAIGQGLPMAIGAGLAHPKRSVVLLAGDGGFAVSLGEFLVAVQHQLKLVVVLFNDAGYAILRNLQDAYFNGRRFGVDLQPYDGARTAGAMGGWGCRVESADAFGPALRRALAQDGPAVLDVDMRAIGPMAVPFTGAARLVPEQSHAR